MTKDKFKRKAYHEFMRQTLVSNGLTNSDLWATQGGGRSGDLIGVTGSRVAKKTGLLEPIRPEFLVKLKAWKQQKHLDGTTRKVELCIFLHFSHIINSTFPKVT